MIVRRLAWSGLVGLALWANQVVAVEPARLDLVAPTNQQLADDVAARLRQAGVLKDYTVEIVTQDGKVELKGVIADAKQRQEVLRLVQSVRGVQRVVDGLIVKDEAIRRVRDEGTPKLPALDNGGAPGILTPPTPGAGPGSGGAGAGGMIPEPTPIFRVPQPAFAALNPPALPPYAWPTYAPYNNFSRVAYPTAYPYNAWPFIGPIYPFPKVPLGWRSVKLEWDDGYWWFSRVGHPHNWWKLRFW
ncbi:MAG: BON domain-containing protein [Gemmataceae bacterium]